MIKTKYEIIKIIVEKASNNKDLAISGHYDGLSLVRYVYYKLCKDYIKKDYCHTSAAKAIKRGHNNSIYGLKTFDKLKSQKFFHTYLELHDDCFNKLIKLESKINNLILK